MKFLFSFFLIFLFISSYSQETIRFNVTNSISDNPVGRNIFNLDTCYYLVGAKRINNKGFVTAYKYDTLGNLLWYKSYGYTIYSWIDGVENNCIRTNNGYCLGGNCTLYEDPITQNIRLYNFNTVFDTIWTKIYLSDSIEHVAYATAYCNDGGFIIAGWSKRDAETGEVLAKAKALLLRTDADGNYLWHKTYGTTDYTDSFYKIVQTPDGGFLCGGGTQSYGAHTWDWYLVKTDANGNEEWHRTYGSTSYDDPRIGDILLTSDTNYVISGGIAINNDETKPYIKVLDKDFTLVQTITLPYQSQGAYLAQLKEIDGGFIGLGGDRINTNNCVLATLSKFDTEFNELWHRKYTVGDTTNTDEYLLSVDTCSDGGYIMGGWASHFGQKLGLIKTDSLGCDGTDWWECSTGVMVNEYVHNPNFSFYPNPANDFVIINCHFDRSGEIPNNTVALYNLHGQLVKQIVMSSGTERVMSSGVESVMSSEAGFVMSSEVETSLTINISDLQKGVYIIRVGKQTKRLIIE